MNRYEEICVHISQRCDSFVKMHAIGESGKPFYITTEEYFQKVMQWYEQFGADYSERMVAKARLAKKQVIEIIEDLNKEIKESEALLAKKGG